VNSWNSFACCSAVRPDAGIRDRKLAPVASVRHLAHPQRGLALFRELAGIAQQIEQYLLEPHGVGGERTQVLLRFDDEAVLVLLGELSRRADDFIDEPSQINRLGIELELAGFDLREVQYLVDEAEEVGKADDGPVCRGCGIPAGAFGELVSCGADGPAGLYHLRCWTDERTKGPLRKPPLGQPGDSLDDLEM
jgi:hypothetical protein